MNQPFRLTRKLGAGLALIGAVALAAPAFAADHAEQVKLGGRTRSFSVHQPGGAAPRGGYPVILAFHGGGGQGRGMERLTGLDAQADARGFLVVYPDGIDKHWNDGRNTIKNPQDDIGFVAAMLDRIEARYPVDRGRIYATGISNGALFAERLGCAMAERIAAIAPVSGSLPADLAPNCHPARAVAVLQIDGTSDPIMPFGGGKVADFGGRGEGGVVLSVAETAAFWARHNGCGAPGSVETLRPTAVLDRTRVTRQSYEACPAGGTVRVLAVEGGGHAWPGGAQYAPAFIIGKASRQIDASQAIVDFFLALPPR